MMKYTDLLGKEVLVYRDETAKYERGVIRYVRLNNDPVEVFVKFNNPAIGDIGYVSLERCWFRAVER